MLTLVFFCAVVAVASLVAGWLPLIWTSLLQTKELSQFSSGVILGTAFLIVVPEGYEQVSEAGWGSAAGLAVVAGFLLMLVIDKVYSVGNSPADTEGSANYGTASGGSLNAGISGYDEIELRNPKTWFKNVCITTFGMTIHAAADGVALAAASAPKSHTKLKVIVFLSILLHKMPASFSLTSVLLSLKDTQHMPLSQIKRDVILFSLAGPVTALLLALPLSLIHISSEPKVLMGICLAFSGGTFVFVATHILEQVQSESDHDLRPVAIIASGTVLPFLASLIPE